MTTRSSRSRTNGGNVRTHGRTGEIFYPETDGKPMAESDTNRDELIRQVQTLQHRFRDRPDMYVSGNLLIYYEQGNPRRSVAPDVFVCKGVPKRRRDIYKIWEEGVAPCFVIEVTSPTTRREDQGKKRDLYARLGVQEYILYDPRALYLRPALQGYRLRDGQYERIAPAPDGSLFSEELELRLALVDGLLEFFDPVTGEKLLNPLERAEAEAARADAEAAARRALEQRLAEVERRPRQRETRGPGANGSQPSDDNENEVEGSDA